MPGIAERGHDGARLATRLWAKLLPHDQSCSRLSIARRSIPKARKSQSILFSLKGRFKFFCGAHAADALFLLNHVAGTGPGWH